MATNSFQNGRQTPHPLNDDGKGYRIQLRSRAQALLNSLMNLLPSNYLSQIPGPNYTAHLKAFAVELARVTLTLEDLVSDVSFEDVRSEFLHQVVGYLLFTDEVPDLDLNDEAFRNFLLTVIEIYFRGSTPDSIRRAVELFTTDDVVVREMYREDASDISEQHAFSVEFETSSTPPQDLFDMQSNMRLLVDLVRPAHTIFKFNWIFREDVDLLSSVTDTVTWRMDDYKYDDVRSYWSGLWGFESPTGRVDASEMSVLTDDDTDRPLYAVNVGANLRVHSGPNEGRYRVIGRPDAGSLRVHPRFVAPETGVDYRVEIDRLGRKRERHEIEDASLQIRDTTRLTVDAGGPYATTWDQPVTLTATASYADVEFEWDLDGDNVYDDASGFQAPFDPSQMMSQPGDVVLADALETYQDEVVSVIYDDASDALVDFELETFDLVSPAPTTVSLAAVPETGTVRVYHNGLLLTPGTEYSVSGADVHVAASSGAAAGGRIAVVYSETPDGTSREIFSVVGPTASHTLASAPEAVQVYRNGVLLTPVDDYTVSGAQILYEAHAAPGAGDVVVAIYRTAVPVPTRDDFSVAFDGQRSFDLSTPAERGQILVWHSGLFVSPDEWDAVDDRTFHVWVRAVADDGRRARAMTSIQVT